MTRDDFYLFWDGPLSQWQPAEFVDQFGHRYNCCEQYMMHQKALVFGDHDTAQKIMLASTPKEQKALGRQIANFNDETWLKFRFPIVWQGNFLRFSQQAAQRRFLLDTSDKVIVEASPYDKIWGVGLPADHPDIIAPDKWPGLNLLGEVLMSVRETFKLGQKRQFK